MHNTHQEFGFFLTRTYTIYTMVIGNDHCEWVERFARALHQWKALQPQEMNLQFMAHRLNLFVYRLVYGTLTTFKFCGCVVVGLMHFVQCRS